MSTKLQHPYGPTSSEGPINNATIKTEIDRAFSKALLEETHLFAAKQHARGIGNTSSLLGLGVLPRAFDLLSHLRIRLHNAIQKSVQSMTRWEAWKCFGIQSLTEKLIHRSLAI